MTVVTNSTVRSAHLHLGMTAYAMATSAATGAKTTTAWTTKGCRGRPAISMCSPPVVGTEAIGICGAIGIRGAIGICSGLESLIRVTNMTKQMA